MVITNHFLSIGVFMNPLNYTLNILKFSIIPLSTLLTHEAFSYEIKTQCTAKEPYQYHKGTCNSQGLLHGKGAVTSKSDGTYLVGTFNNGVPDGQMLFIDGDGAIDEYLRTNKLPSYPHYRYCNIRFKNGVPDDNSPITCKGDTYSYTITPTQGIQWQTSKPNASFPYFIIDVPSANIELEGEYITGISLFNHKNAKLTGTGDYSIRSSGNWSITDIKGTVQLPNNAYLDGHFNLTYCRNFADLCIGVQQEGVYRYLGEKSLLEDNIDPKYIYTYYYQKNGQRYDHKLIFGTHKYRNTVRYYKDHLGVEFEGRVCYECHGSIIHGANPPEIDIKPWRGKISLPNGTTFSGYFDRDTGQPSQAREW